MSSAGDVLGDEISILKKQLNKDLTSIKFLFKHDKPKIEIKNNGMPRYPIYPNERQRALLGLIVGLILGSIFSLIILFVISSSSFWKSVHSVSGGIATRK